MSLTSLRPVLLASLLAIAGAAQAATITVPVDPSGNFTVVDTTPPDAGETWNLNIAPSTNPIPVIFYDQNVPDQSASNIRTTIAAAYSASGSSLAFATMCDDIPGGGCAGVTSSAGQLQISGVSPFDYLAIHFGGGELFFHWATPITSILLTNLDGQFPNGLSNYRSYLTTPLPGALALFLGALGFLGLRRKAAEAAEAEPMPA